MHLRRTAVVLAASLGALLTTAAPAPAGTAYAAPGGCTPSAIDATGNVCLNGVLVVSTDNNAPGGGTAAVVTDGVTTRTLSIAMNWWQMGPPTAGQIITAWGVAQGGGPVAVTHWIDRTHGAGPTDADPLVSALDISAGKVPVNRMVWVPVTTFATLPQYTNAPVNGDGDVHLQSAWGCPSAGVTLESTPAMYGLVDHAGAGFGIPAGVDPWSLTPPPDVATAQVPVDDPPPNTPILALGQVRYDPGYGWWEVHPIRAWHVMTAADLAAAGQSCAAAPAPQTTTIQTDPALPAPYGFPTCGELPEGGQSIPTEAQCQNQCTVAATHLGRPETLSSECAAAGVTPRQTDAQGAPNGSPAPDLPETPAVTLLPLAAAVTMAGAVALQRRRRRVKTLSCAAAPGVRPRRRG